MDASENKIIRIDLTGSQGNAFFLIKQVENWCKQKNYQASQFAGQQIEVINFDKIYKEMTSGDYENLIKTVDKYFGDFVIMYR